MLKRHGLKKGLSLVLVLCLILSLMPTVALAQEPEAAAPGTETTVGVTGGETGSETTTPPTEGGETTTPPTEGGETTTPPTEGGETTTPPTEGGETTTPPTEGGETTTPPTEGGETTTPPTEGDVGMTDEPGTVEDPGTVEETETTPTIPHMATKPEDGKSAYQPFDAHTGGSEHFRIPALVTTESGRLVAAADARWNTTADGYGLDTIVARSNDNGDVWRNTFANYLGDNGNVSDSTSTAYIDPALAADGKIVYMLVDLFPGGVTIQNAQKGTGFDKEGHLLLKESGASDYNYYVGDFKDGYAPVLSKDGTGTGYKVDAFYNLYGGEKTSNVFFADADFQVYPTSYLYLTVSHDGGSTWSEPQLLNPQVKEEDESFYGVGPGRGLVTKDGTIMFPCYVYDGQYGQRSSFIYLDKNSETWQRTDDIAATWSNWWSSESQLVELNDGTIRCFFRNGNSKICYADYNRNTDSWSDSVSTSISVESNCQISAISYSETIEGRQAILLSCPSGSGRANGKIYVMLVNGDKSMTELRAFDVTTGGDYFGYSCLTELADGRIAILYEGDSNFGSLTFGRYTIEDVAGWDAAIGDNVKVEDTASGVTVSAPGLEKIQVTSNETVAALEGTNRPYVAYDFTLTANGQNYAEPALVYIPAEQIADLENPVGFVVNSDNTIEEITGYYTEDEEYFVFEMPHFSTGGVVGDEVDPLTNYNDERTIELVEGKPTTITLPGNVKDQVLTEGLLDTSVATVEVTVNTLPEESYEEMTPVTNVTSGQAYYIQNSEGKYLDSNAEWVNDVNSAAQWTWSNRKLQSGSKYLQYYYYGSYYSGLTTTSRSNQATTWSESNGSFSVSSRYYDYTLGQACTKRTVTSEGGQQTVITVTAQHVIDETYFAVGRAPEGTLYHIVVREKPDVEENGYLVSGTDQVTKLTTTVNTSYTLSVPDGVTDSVTWESGDSGIATVSGGTITGVSQGSTTVTATVTEDGSPVATYTIPVQVWNSGVTSWGSFKTTEVYIDNVKDTTVYYSLDCTNQLVETQEGELFYLKYPTNANMALDFFGAPDDGYALTYMAATDTASQYLSLNSTDPTKTDFYTKDGAGKNQLAETAFRDKVAPMIQAALKLNCDGALGFTRPSSNTTNINHSDLTFRSEKLPTVTKEVISVGGNDYTAGMVAHKGDTVRFKITVTQYACQDAITYTNPSLKDLLSDATFAGTSSSTTTPTLHSYALGQDQVKEYYVNYTIKDSDLDTIITNTAQLSYTYQSGYSSGSFSGSANAAAKISAVTFDPASIVVDFGLPVVLDFSGTDNHGRYDLVSGSATYGDVTVSGNKVTYTPNTVLTGVDTVTLFNEKGGTYTFNVYPATTVYYEEGFATVGKGFTSGSMGTGYQEMSVTGHGDRYGYDVAYEGYIGASNKTEMTSSTVGDYVTFDFHGTGVEIYANCTPSSGSVMIQVYKGTEKNPMKTLLVNTAMVNGYSEATNFQSVTGYNVPIASLLDLSSSPADYTVKITNVENKGVSGTVSLDGFRVHGTLDTSDPIYSKDGESEPTFVQLRDAVLAGVDTAESRYADQIAANVMSQVYAFGHSTNVVVFEQSGSGIEVGQDLLDFGPKNELYLAKDQTVTFKLAANAQIGLKALNAAVSYKINGQEETLNSSTDMFTRTYSAGDEITITNNGDGILAITQIKAVNGSPTTAARANTLVLQPLTADDLMPALVAMGYDLSDEED